MTKDRILNDVTRSVKKTLSNKSLRALAISLAFLLSGIGASVLINPAYAATQTVTTHPASAAPAPLTQAQANWEFPNGNAFNQDYNPQTQINSSDASYLGLSWIYPLPSAPSALSGYAGYFVPAGVGQAIIIVNGTALATTVFDEVLAFNVANGNLLWTYTVPLTLNATAGEDSGPLPLHSHDGNQWFTTASFASGVSGPTFWLQGQNNKVYAISETTGKLELNFTDFSGDSMVPGNNPGSIYNGIGASNIIIDQTRGILVSGHDAESDADNGRGFFAGWNLNANPPKLAWVATDVPPQPGSSIGTNPNYDVQMINNMSYAYTFWPGKDGSTNGYTIPAEVAGGVLMNTNDDIVVNWKSLSATQLNATLYNDWGQVGQSAQCLAITGGASTGSTGSAWGGAWLLGSGQTSGIAFVATNNKDPFTGPCNPGPDLWSASVLALNDTTGKWIWGLQTTTHDVWDYDCSWYQALANETINGVNTEVMMKTCKNGYLYEINALTGDLIWAWDPPASIMPRCPICYPMNPMNTTQTSIDFPTALTTYHTQPETGPQPPFLQYPSELAGFEDQQSYDPTTNMIYAAAHIVPYYMSYIGLNSSTYFTSTGETGTPVNEGTCSDCVISNNNATIFAISAATGQIAWHYFIADQGYRGGVVVSGNIVYATLSSGDILMINAASGSLVRDFYIGAPMDQFPSIGASTTGQESILLPVGTCSFEAVVTCPGTTTGDVVALTLQNLPSSIATASTQTVTTTLPGQTITTTSAGQTITTTIPGQTITTTIGAKSTVTTTATAPGVTVTSTSSSGVSSAALYGVAVVAVIFIIATGYLAMRGRKPAS